MLDATTYGLFLVTAAVVVLSPGPDTILVLSRTLASGGPAGIMTLLGTQVGNVMHAVLAGIGVSTVVLLFPLAYDGLKVAGVAYLLYLGLQAWRAAGHFALDPGLERGGTAWRFFGQGLLNNLANAKMIAFFLALFPQFIRPDAGSLAVQSLVLGATLAAMTLVWLGLVVLAVARARAVVARSRRVITANVPPSSRLCKATGPWSGRMNCGKSARKKAIIFGLARLFSRPWAKKRQAVPPCSSRGSSASSAGARQACTPRWTR